MLAIGDLLKERVSLHHGDALKMAEIFPAESFQAIVTSPPYWGLRMYASATWTGGSADCDHSPASTPGKRGLATSTLSGGNKHSQHQQEGYNTCPRCGAVRTDDQIGQEPVHDCLAWARNEPPCGSCFVCNIRKFAAQAWKVLRDDGVLFINLGDSYAGPNTTGLKAKDLCMIPARAAMALQSDGWLLRSFIPWVKRNPMPNSQGDRPTTSTEFLMMLTKRAEYFFDMPAVRRPVSTGNRNSRFDDSRDLARHGNVGMGDRTEDGLRHLRESDFFFDSLRAILDGDQGPLTDGESLFALPVNVKGYSGAHFATWPPKLVEVMLRSCGGLDGCCAGCRKPYRSGQPACKCNAGKDDCLILDPFTGSGTTLLVARQLGLRSAGLDLSEQYLVEDAAKRLQLDKLNAWAK